MPVTILVVDDSPTLRGIVKIYLRPLQVEVMEADGGERALRQIDQVTQENAAGAEQASGISAELAAQTRTLRGQVEALKRIVGGRSTAG